MVYSLDTPKVIARLLVEIAEDELESALDLHGESLSMPEFTPQDRFHKLVMLQTSWNIVKNAEQKVEHMEKEQARVNEEHARVSEEQATANKEQASVKEELQKWNISKEFIVSDLAVVAAIMH